MRQRRASIGLQNLLSQNGLPLRFPMPDNEVMTCAATSAELKAKRRECWNPGYQRRAFLCDWKGWKWCARCWWRQAKDGTHWWVELRNLRVF